MENSIEGVEAELAGVERKLATLRETLKRSHGESAAQDAALREMGIRAKEIMNRPKTWRGGLKSSDAAELEALRADMQARTETMSRTIEAMRSMSAEATELSKRHQDLSKMRADLVGRDDRGSPPLLATGERGPSVVPLRQDVLNTGPRPVERGGRSTRRRPE